MVKEKEMNCENETRAVSVGLDPSLTGFAVHVIYPNGSSYSVEYSSKPSKTLRGRIQRYRDLMEKVIKIIRKVYPRIIVLEGYSYGSKGRSVITLGEFGGIVRDRLIGYSDWIAEVPPTVLKKFVCGKGNANKAAVVSAATKRYSEEFDSDNQADAYVLARMGLVALGLEGSQTQFQKEAIEKVLREDNC
jgi:crossover junction endodeoxyribonuclease RuvC